MTLLVWTLHPTQELRQTKPPSLPRVVLATDGLVKLGMPNFVLVKNGNAQALLGGLTQPKNSKRAHLTVPALQNTTRTPRKDLPEMEV